MRTPGQIWVHTNSGGYPIGSANRLRDYCKRENVAAMPEPVKKFVKD